MMAVAPAAQVLVRSWRVEREGHMAPKPLKRLYKAATGAALRRDQIEMESIDRLLSPLAPGRAPRPMDVAAIRRWRTTGFRSILCPVDFSAQSRVALRYAAALATRSHGRLSILYVNDPLLIAAAGIALHDRTLATRNLAELRRFVESTVSPARPGTGTVRRRGHERNTGRRDREGRKAPPLRPDRDGHPWPDRAPTSS